MNLEVKLCSSSSSTLDVSGLVRIAFVDDFVKSDSQRPNVAFGGVGGSVKHLRRHVQGSSQVVVHDLVRTGQGFGEPKVDDFRNPVFEQDIIGLDVSVDNVVDIKMFQALDDPQSHGGVVDVGGLAQLALAMFCYDVNVIHGLEQAQHLDNVGVGRQTLENRQLVLEFLVGIHS